MIDCRRQVRDGFLEGGQRLYACKNSCALLLGFGEMEAAHGKQKNLVLKSKFMILGQRVVKGNNGDRMSILR